MKKSLLRYTLFFLFVSTLLMQSFVPKAAVVGSEKYKVQALFIYTFTNYITWDYSARVDFTIVVNKNSEIIPYLKQIKDSKKVGNKSIVVKTVDLAVGEAIPDCDVFYFESKDLKLAEAQMAKKNMQNILVVSQLSAAIESYGNINLKEVSDSYKFEVYKKNIEKNKMKVSSNLLKLAIKIYE